MTQYGLSNRQHKELVERGRPLLIAIPAPEREEYDELAFARAALADVDPAWIVSADEIALPVATQVRRGPEGSLQAAIGEFVVEGHQPIGGEIKVLVLCVVAELRAVSVARHAPALQWAGRIIHEKQRK